MWLTARETEGRRGWPTRQASRTPAPRETASPELERERAASGIARTSPVRRLTRTGSMKRAEGNSKPSRTHSSPSDGGAADIQIATKSPTRSARQYAETVSPVDIEALHTKSRTRVQRPSSVENRCCAANHAPFGTDHAKRVIHRQQPLCVPATGIAQFGDREQIDNRYLRVEVREQTPQVPFRLRALALGMAPQRAERVAGGGRASSPWSTTACGAQRRASSRAPRTRPRSSGLAR